MQHIILITVYADIFTTTSSASSTSIPITNSIISTPSNNLTTGANDGMYYVYHTCGTYVRELRILNRLVQ